MSGTEARTEDTTENTVLQDTTRSRSASGHQGLLQRLPFVVRERLLRHRLGIKRSIGRGKAAATERGTVAGRKLAKSKPVWVGVPILKNAATILGRLSLLLTLLSVASG
jgi:hypothetical protein